MKNTRKDTVLVLGIAGAIVLSGCTASKQTGSVEIPAPFHEVETDDIAAEETGIKLTAPASLAGLSKRTVLVFNDDRMVEVFYSDEEGNKTATVRKAVKDDYDSGDFNSCETVEEVTTTGGITSVIYAKTSH